MEVSDGQIVENDDDVGWILLFQSANLHASSKSQASSGVYSIGRSEAWERHRDPVSHRKTESSGTRAAIGRTLDDDENLNLNQLSL